MEKHSRSPSIYLDSYTILHMWGNNTCFDAYFLMTEKWQLLKFRSRHKCIMWAKAVSKLTCIFFQLDFPRVPLWRFCHMCICFSVKYMCMMRCPSIKKKILYLKKWGKIMKSLFTKKNICIYNRKQTKQKINLPLLKLISAHT